uniref:Putative secreted protein n=1 Tax=Anopheles darlingi TaxID=43151 RepID=A0A2M4DBI0_ANODA
MTVLLLLVLLLLLLLMLVTLLLRLLPPVLFQMVSAALFRAALPRDSHCFRMANTSVSSTHSVSRQLSGINSFALKESLESMVVARDAGVRWKK